MPVRNTGALLVVIVMLVLAMPAASLASPAAASCNLKLARKTNPKLPKYLRGTRSDLVVLVRVNAEGRVSQAEVVRGTGNKEVDTAVVDSIKKDWRYKPVRADCAPVEESISITLEYHDHVINKSPRN